MKSFKDFLYEEILYRGIPSSGHKYGSSPVVWFTYDKEFAKEYSMTDISTRSSREGRVISINYKPKRSFDIRDADRRIAIMSFLAEAMKQSKVDFKTIKDKGTSLRKIIIDKFGKREDYVHQYWQDSSVIEFLDLLGFDSIVAMESGRKTIGIFRDYL